MKRVMGFWRCWGLVVGIMIGNGIFMLPAVLAPFGKMSFVGWIVAATGTIFIALMFGQLTRRKPAVGGFYAYTRDAFGDLPGFFIAWGYWISILTAVAAGAVAVTGYIGFFFPTIVSSPAISGLVSLALIWITTGINVAGIKTASTFQLITSTLKLLPLFAVAAGGIVVGNFDSLFSADLPLQESTKISFNFSEMIMIIMWAYVGVESITLPSDDVIAPKKNIPRALIFGTLTASLIYILVSYGVMSLMPANELATSTAPIADAASIIFGPWGSALIALGGIISIISSTNANVFIIGVMPQALANDGLFPQHFSKLNKNGSTAFAIVSSGFIASVLLAMNFSEGLMGAFKTLILLSTLTVLLPYAVSSAAELVMQKREYQQTQKMKWQSLFIAVVALLFSIFAIVGSGVVVALQGTFLLFIGLPFYYFSKKTN